MFEARSMDFDLIAEVFMPIRIIIVIFEEIT
jgi:hypothetical protein